MEFENERMDSVVSNAYLLKDDEADQDSDSETEPALPQPINAETDTKRWKTVVAITLTLVVSICMAIAIVVLVVVTLTSTPVNDTVVSTAQSTIAPASTLLSSEKEKPKSTYIRESVICLGGGGGGMGSSGSKSDGSGCKKKMIGSGEDGVHVFKGIRYAQPPTLEMRWKPPQPFDLESVVTDDKPYDARSFGEACAQMNESSSAIEGSEDCLFLNVWSPNLSPDAGLHVMVYIHGGGLISGSGHQINFMPTSELVSVVNVVFVTFNYRLNAFGFMALEALAADGGASGNYGFMDQILTLKWVKENIAFFGGNPNKVTAFGQGSGATSIYALLASDETDGLFEKAWLASPSAKLESSLMEAYRQNLKFLNKTGCSSEYEGKESISSCLRNLSTDSVIRSLPLNEWKNEHFYRLPQMSEKSSIIAVVDGVVLKSSPLDVWKKKKLNTIQLLIGTTEQEADNFPTNGKLVDSFESFDWTKYDDYVRQIMFQFEHVNVTELLAMYDRDDSPERSITSMISDMRVVCPVDEMAKVVANVSKTPIFRYVVAYRYDYRLRRKNYAYSGIDVEAFFDVGYPNSAFRRDRFTDVIREVVFDFVRGGAVSGGKSFPRSTYRLSNVLSTVPSRFTSKECNFWRTNWFFPTFARMN